MIFMFETHFAAATLKFNRQLFNLGSGQMSNIRPMMFFRRLAKRVPHLHRQNTFS